MSAALAAVPPGAPASADRLSHLKRLEAESIHIFRETVAEAENPVMLYSIGKDSSVLLHLALKAFAVAIIGGLESGLGVIVGGLILGVAETLTGFYISTGYKDVPGLILLLVVLSIRPVGLFGKAVIKKV